MCEWMGVPVCLVFGMYQSTAEASSAFPASCHQYDYEPFFFFWGGGVSLGACLCPVVFTDFFFCLARCHGVGVCDVFV